MIELHTNLYLLCIKNREVSLMIMPKKELIMIILSVLALFYILTSFATPVFAEKYEEDTIAIGNISDGTNTILYVRPTNFAYDFIVIWEDPEGLDILSHPWTGYNYGIYSKVIYRLAYHEHIRVTGVVRNNRDNIFLRLTDGNYVYSKDVAFDFEKNGQLMADYHANHKGGYYSKFRAMCGEVDGVMNTRKLDPSSKNIPYNVYYKSENRVDIRTAEDIGNMLFGYVARKIGMSSIIAKLGNAYHNITDDDGDNNKGNNNSATINSCLNSWCDDPKDVSCINEGISYYNRNK